MFEDGAARTSKPTTPKEKEAPAKLVPAPPPKENVWQKRQQQVRGCACVGGCVGEV